MESLITDKNQRDLKKLAGYISKSMSFENDISEKVKKKMDTTAYPNPLTECKPPM